MNGSVRVKTLQIDGRDVSAGEDETILDIARENGIFLPTLCHLDGLTEVGACRLCLVEVKGISKLLPACATRVEEGMEVLTNSEQLQHYRKTILELLGRSEEHTSELQSPDHLVCRLLLEKKKIRRIVYQNSS